MYVPMSMNICAYMHLKRPEKGIGSLVAGVTGECEPPCGCWGLNCGSLQQQVLLTAHTHTPDLILGRVVFALFWKESYYVVLATLELIL